MTLSPESLVSAKSGAGSPSLSGKTASKPRAVGIVRVSHVGGRGGESFLSPEDQEKRIRAGVAEPRPLDDCPQRVTIGADKAEPSRRGRGSPARRRDEGTGRAARIRCASASRAEAPSDLGHADGDRTRRRWKAAITGQARGQ